MMQANYTDTRDIPLDQLTPYPGNARRGNVDVILDSLRRNGQYRSLVVRASDDQHTVLAGNHTMRGLAAHGPGPCTYTNTGPDGEHPCGICHNQAWEPAARAELITCDDDTARRINLVDNRAADLGDYDNEALTELLTGLEDYEGTGYTEEDVASLLATPQLPEEGDADTGETEPVWGVLIECDNERQQTDLLERLVGEGHQARALLG